MGALNYFTLHNGVQMPSIGTGFSSYLTDGPKSASVSRMPTGDTIKSMVLSGIDLGYRLFDTAHCYGSEADLGEATQLVYSQKGLTRKDLFLTTKIGVFRKDTLFIDSMFYLQEEFKYKSIADIVQESVKESLEKLQTNYIDLLLLHWPTPDFMLFWRELEKLYEEKIVRAIGVCNFEVGQLEQIISACKIKPMVNQVHISPLKPQTKLFEYCQKHNILLEIWSSLLPLRMEKLGENLKIKKMCKNYRCSPAQLLLRWNQQRGCIPLATSWKPARQKENITLNFDIDEKDMRILSSGNIFFSKNIKPKKIIKFCTKNILKTVNLYIKNTEWYCNTYSDIVQIKQHDIYNLDLMILGSTAVKYGLDFSKQNIKAVNFATAPQDTATSLAIIKNYHCFIKENGIIIILLLCPFQGLGLDYPPNGDYHNRLHYFLHPALVKNFSEQTFAKANREIEYPLLFKTKMATKALVKKIIGREQRTIDPHIDAAKRLAGWTREFGIKALEDPLSAENKAGVAKRIDQLCEIVEFCNERNIRPVFAIMPTTKILQDMIPAEFMQKAFYDVVEEVKRKTNVPFFDFYRSAEFLDESLYRDSFLMNKKGRKLFTDSVIRELKKIEYI